jgi:hypothetical protein
MVIKIKLKMFCIISKVLFAILLVGCSSKSQKDLLIEYVMQKENVFYGAATGQPKDYIIVDSLSKEWLNSEIFMIEAPGTPDYRFLLA